MSQTMLEAHVHGDTSVTLHSVSVPHIAHPNDVLVRVICASCNPKDWKMPAGILKTIADCPNSGDDLAGIVEEVGTAVTSLKPGDRVAALHELGAPFGAYAQFAMVQDFVCIKISDDMGLDWEQAATLPMALYMACVGLFGCLKLSAGPWEKVQEKSPLLIYGAAAGVGCMALQLAQAINVHPVICVAGGSRDHVAQFIDESKGDVILDYRAGPDAVIEGVQAALGGQELVYVFDAVSEISGLETIAKVIKPDGGHIALTLPGRAHVLPGGLNISHIMAGSLWKKLDGLNKEEKLGNLGLDEGGPEFAKAITSGIQTLLSEGVIKPHPHVVYEGGLNGLEAALKCLREGKVHSSRCVVRVADTPGIQAKDGADCHSAS